MQPGWLADPIMESPGKQSRPRWIARLIVPLVLLALAPLWLAVGCQSKLIYFPRPYPPDAATRWERKTAGKTIDFQTSQGQQRAFLQGNLKSPRNLWIVCGGNGTVALDWSDWLRQHGPAEDAWLLVDFPGYGDCEGKPSPSSIRETFKAAVPLAIQKTGWPADQGAGKLRFFGHSLGGAASLIAASEFGIQRGVLLAPFTSTMEMSRELTGLPLGFLVWHRFDNNARFADLAKRGPGKVIILHGTDDEVIPVAMSRRLAAGQKEIVRLREIPDGRHNTIQDEHAQELSKALREVSAD
jgi:pimeloyl-ACP methyl ester carboxylesterase